MSTFVLVVMLLGFSGGGSSGKPHTQGHHEYEFVNEALCEAAAAAMYPSGDVSTAFCIEVRNPR